MEHYATNLSKHAEEDDGPSWIRDQHLPLEAFADCTGCNDAVS
ncbi:hypothetical protein RISK_001382 [Rhodopirellula islandica]|uniref:Uncharacterized protein n=1 Tax=Rhodopirellula islandica TaxID=595434 RepID=A0A0J1BJD6_RHOIS|nr:hypothetical protein [Rhodopirellula islandica]KLU06627.1 hypothetical protein RISK_001382 [Rhodopirellula islandica]